VNETNSNLAAAWVAAFAEITGAAKNAKNPHFKSNYADLPSVIEAIRGPLSAHELSFLQINHPNDKGVQIETVLLHKSGEQMSLGSLFIPATKQDAQGFGSASTYCRRFSLQTAFGLPALDDDGELARVAADRDAKQQISPQILAELRSAAIGGPDALKAAFAEHKDAPGFAVTWKQHGESLKAAAAQAQPA
jgi:hypothetical protein